MYSDELLIPTRAVTVAPQVAGIGGTVLLEPTFVGDYRTLSVNIMPNGSGVGTHITLYAVWHQAAPPYVAPPTQTLSYEVYTCPNVFGQLQQINIPIVAPWVEIWSNGGQATAQYDISAAVSTKSGLPITPLGSSGLLNTFTGARAPGTTITTEANYCYYGNCQFAGTIFPQANQSVFIDVYQRDGNGLRQPAPIYRASFAAVAAPPLHIPASALFGARGLTLSVDITVSGGVGNATIQYAISPAPSAIG